MNKNIESLCALLFAVAVSACGSGTSGGAAPASPASAVARWERQAANPLIVPRLTPGTLDFGPADPSVLFDADDGKWKAWFSSTLKDLTSGAETMTIKYSESADGVSWSSPQIAFQVAADAGAWDHTHAETPTVIKNPSPTAPATRKFLLWYSGANTTLAAAQRRPTLFPYYRIGLAYSVDGRSFTRHTPGLDNNPGLVLSATASLFGAALPGVFGDGLVADPEVVHHGGLYHMWFSSYAETVPSPAGPSGRTPLAFGIAHATSPDGVTWTAAHSNPLASLAKPGEVASGQQPSVLFNTATSQFEMWFSNDTAAEKATIPCSFNTVQGFWHAVSSDGINWSPDYRQRALSYDTRYGYESLGFLTGIEVVLVDGSYRAYYVAWGTQQIPDPSLYRCPDQQGGLIPAVLTLSMGTYVSP